MYKALTSAMVPDKDIRREIEQLLKEIPVGGQYLNHTITTIGDSVFGTYYMIIVVYKQG